MAYTKKRKRYRISRTIISTLGIILVLGATIFGGSILIRNVFFNNQYEKYDVFNDTTKKYGTMKHESKLEKEVYYQSLYYPEFKDENLNKLVDAYLKKIKAPEKGYGMKFIQLDYDCALVADRFVSLTFHYQELDESDQVLNKKAQSINYDLSNKKQLKYDDVLRRNYIELLKNKAGEAKIDEALILRNNLNNFILSNDGVSFYFNQDSSKAIKIKYEENKQYIALCDPKIPSLHMEKVEAPKSQPKVIEGKKLIAFTFDDGPHSSNTKAIMDEFEKYDGRATFFMLGQNVEANNEMVKEVYARGHEVGNHSWDHSMAIAAYNDPNYLMSAEDIAENELYNTNDAIFKACGYEPRYFRPPYGALNDRLQSVCMMDLVKWDIDSLDWQSHNPDAMFDIIRTQAAVGYDVVLMHDIHDETVDGVKKILRELDAQGYQFVTIDTLLKNDKNKYLTEFNATRENNVVLKSLLGVSETKTSKDK